MSHIAVVAPPFLGHLNPMLALAAALRAKHHRVTLVGIADVEAVAGRAGCDFIAVGQASHGLGTLEHLSSRLARPGGFGLGRVMTDMVGMTAMLCRDLPAVCRSASVEAIVSDQLEPAGALVAAALDLPNVTVANALPIHREPGVPPPFVGWRYDGTPWGVKRNAGGYRVADALMRPVSAGLERASAALGIAPRRSLEDCLSSLVDLTQLVPELDFPHVHLPATVHPCGPLRAPPDDADVSDLLDPGRPLVFASLGTLQGGRFPIFEAVAVRCARLGLHLVIAHGGRLSAAEVAALPGRPVVRDFVPQRSLLRHADLAIINGGLNTVMDAAAAGVPMLVVPIAFEQGAIAARVAHAGVGAVGSRWRLGRLGPQIDAVLRDGAMTQRARVLADAVGRYGGATAAAALIAEVLATGRPAARTAPAARPSR